MATQEGLRDAARRRSEEEARNPLLKMELGELVV